MKKKVIVLASIITLIILIGLGYKMFGNNNTGQATGHWRNKPKSTEDIVSVELVYNGGHDRIYIYHAINEILYEAYDDNGDYVRDDNGEAISNRISVDTTDIINDVFNNIDKMNDGRHNDSKWAIAVDTISSTCVAQGTDSEPEWFNELLVKLNVDQYGYIYK